MLTTLLVIDAVWLLLNIAIAARLLMRPDAKDLDQRASQNALAVIGHPAGEDV